MDTNSHLHLFFEPIRDHLQDESVSEILINGPQQIYIERRGRLVKSAAVFASEHALKAAAVNVARSVGRALDEANPRLDARLPDGSRVHAVLPPVSRAGTAVAIRKFSRERLTIEQLVALSSVSAAGAQLLEAVVRLRRNIMVSGATSSGKTSVLNVLSRFIPEDQRILVLEDASELQLQQEHTLRFETRPPDKEGRGEVGIRELLHSALRLRPDRLVVGEVRGGEAIDLLQALNTGHDGSMSTIHANGPVDCLRRLETCALLSGVDMPLSALRSQVAAAVHIVVHTARLADGTRKIVRVSEVLGLDQGDYRVADILVYESQGLDAEGNEQGRHQGTGHVPTQLLADARNARIPLDAAMFAKH